MSERALIAERFSRAASRYVHHAALQEEVAGWVVDRLSCHAVDKSALDIGCGTGFIVKKSNNYSNKFTQCDLAFGMCVLARAQAPVVVADAHALPFADRVFDVCVSSLAWQWLDDPVTAFAQARRVTRESFVLATLVNATLVELQAALAAIGEPAHRVRTFHSAETVTEQACAAGWRVQASQVRPVVHRHESFTEALASIRGVGAASVSAGRTPLTRARLNALQAAYPRSSGAYPVSWQVLVLELENPA